MARRLFAIRDFKHRVALCSMQDVITTDGVLELSREDVFHTWACIEARAGSQFSPVGFAIMESREAKTHEIFIRYRSDTEVTSKAWIYDERLKSSSRWFKILSVQDFNEDGQYWLFKCKLYERGDNVIPPTTPEPTIGTAVPLPEGVKL